MRAFLVYKVLPLSFGSKELLDERFFDNTKDVVYIARVELHIGIAKNVFIFKGGQSEVS